MSLPPGQYTIKAAAAGYTFTKQEADVVVTWHGVHVDGQIRVAGEEVGGGSRWLYVQSEAVVLNFVVAARL